MDMWIALLGGLGLFLYGMNMMGDGLENAAGSRLKFILGRLTDSPLKAVAVGTLVTALIQSSSAATVMVVGFVNSGLLNLVQATGVIMGANIGTTITVFLVSIHMDEVIPVFLFTGSVLVIFSQAKKRRDVASVILGFGVMMLGMKLMSQAMYPLRDSEVFRNLIITLGHQWYLGLLIGMGITTLIQSSSATTALLVALTTTGSITIEIAFPFVLGANIGTTVTALLSSITANRTAKKAAMIHLLFNVTGVLLLLPLGPILIQAVTVLVPENIRYQISFLHLFFNVASTLILLPFTGTLIRMANVIVGEEYEIENQILDRRLLQTPSIAEGQVVLETVKLAQLAKLNVKLAIEAYLNNDVSKFDLITENEKKIDEVTLVITDFLVELSANEQAVEEFKRIGHTYHVLNDIERIGDHAENILELAVERNRNAVEITEEGKEELNIIYALTDLALHTAIRSYETRDRELACSIIETERQIDFLQKEYRNTHIKRLQAEKCSALSSIIFLDVISNLERVGDHAKNITDTIVEACENC